MEFLILVVQCIWNKALYVFAEHDVLYVARESLTQRRETSGYQRFAYAHVFGAQKEIR